MQTSKRISESCVVGLCAADVPYVFGVEAVNNSLQISIIYIAAMEEQTIPAVSKIVPVTFSLGRYSHRILGISVSPKNDYFTPYRKASRVVLNQLEAALDELHNQEKREGSKMNYKAVKERLELGGSVSPAWFTEYLSK